MTAPSSASLSSSPPSRLSRATRATRNRWSSAFRAPRSDYLADSKEAASFLLMSRLRDWKRRQGLSERRLSGPATTFAERRRRLRQNGRFSSRLTVIDCAENRASEGNEAPVTARQELGTDAMTNSIGIRTRARRGHRAAQGQMGLDRRPRRGLPRRWRDRSWQRRHGDCGDGLRRRHHDDHRRRLRSHPLVPDQDLGALHLLARCSASSTSLPGSRRSTIRC